MLLFWASLAGYAPSRSLLSAIAGLTLAGLFALRNKGRLIRIKLLAEPWEKGDVWAMAPAALTLLALGVVLINAVSTPLQEWDAFAIWGLKAKVLFHAALRPIPLYFHDLSLSYSHLDYPLLVPFLVPGHQPPEVPRFAPGYPLRRVFSLVGGTLVLGFRARRALSVVRFGSAYVPHVQPVGPVGFFPGRVLSRFPPVRHVVRGGVAGFFRPVRPVRPVRMGAHRAGGSALSPGWPRGGFISCIRPASRAAHILPIASSWASTVAGRPSFRRRPAYFTRFSCQLISSPPLGQL